MMMMMPMMPLAIGDRKDDRFFHAPPPRSFMHSPEKERKERERERERERFFFFFFDDDDWKKKNTY